MNQFFLLSVFAAFTNVCLCQRYCTTRIISSVPASCNPSLCIPAPNIPAPRISAPCIPVTCIPAEPDIDPRAKNMEIIEMAKALAKNQKKAENEHLSHHFTTKVISKLIDALVHTATHKHNEHCDNDGNLLNVALGDQDLLSVSV